MEMKKMKLPLIIMMIMAIGVGAVFATGYGLFTAKSHFNVQEGIEVEYWTGTTWLPLEVTGGTFDLGTATIKAGETNSFTLRARNIATSGVVGLKLNIESIEGLTFDALCNTNSNGLQYTKGSDFLFKAPADSVWRSVDITTTAAGDIATGTVEFDNTLSRQNAESSYVLTC